jgi:uncharacterized protein YbjT (DUF2867 family)
MSEELIRISGLDWAFLRPGMFMSNSIEWWAESIKGQNSVFFPGGKKGKVAPVIHVMWQKLLRWP